MSFHTIPPLFFVVFIMDLPFDRKNLHSQIILFLFQCIIKWDIYDIGALYVHVQYQLQDIELQDNSFTTVHLLICCTDSHVW